MLHSLPGNALFVAWLMWFGLAALIMVVDRRMMANAVTGDGVPDLTDRSPGMYLAFMLLFGGWVIPFYMYNSRRTGKAVIAGILLACTSSLIVSAFLRTQM
jgi:hypothetical protein